ncbi:MAG: hypothetical protein ACERKO_00295 [Acetanaerobacterium sp.]
MRPFVFTAEWGTWSGYFAKKYLPIYNFSGHLEIGGGEITGVEKIVFPRDAWGPFIFSKQFRPYGKTEWQSAIHNGFDGIRVTALAEDDTVLSVVTSSAIVSFTPRELREKGHIVGRAGEKYAMAILHIEPDEPLWREAKWIPGESRLYGRDFACTQADLFGVKGACLPPRTDMTSRFSLPPQETAATDSTFINCHLRFLISERPDVEMRARGLIDFSLSINGREAYRNKKFTTYHDTNSQFLEDVSFVLPAQDFIPGENTAVVSNHDDRFSLLVQMLRFIPETRRHMQVVHCPQWVLAGVPFCVSIRCTSGAARIVLDYDPDLFEMEMPGTKINVRHQMYRGKHYPIPENDEFIWQGEHEFFFVAKKSFQNKPLRFTDEWSKTESIAVVSESWASEQEPEIMKTGVEIKTGTPWEYAEYIRLIRDRQLGNLIVFRDYHNRFTHYQKLWEAAADCRKYGLYTDAISMKDQDIIASASADRCLCAGGHECTGIFYGSRPPENLSVSMRDAQETSVNLLRTVADGYRIPGVPVATGDASGGSRFAYLAGFDILRHETFVGHHLLILPNARGCAKAFGKKTWGAHLATQHNAQPELEDGLRRFWLGFFMAWVFGAGFIYEEDSLFLCFKYYRMVNDDTLPRRKSELCAAFHKYTQTHPRLGTAQVDIAVLQGRFAPPFSGISTTNYGDPPKEESLKNENFPVWGMAGCQTWEWGFRQPEKGFHLLETLAPGIFLNPLNQDAAKVRKIFSGDPRGEFDFLPVEAEHTVLARYQLVLMLNWHTMEPQSARTDSCGSDYELLLRYAKQGGTVFLSVPHLTTRADRGFLRDMDDLKLIYGGDVADLCGVRIMGKSSLPYSQAAGAGDFAQVNLERPLDLLRRPNLSADEDGPCMLADVELITAEIIAADIKSGRPLVVRNRVGRGFVYLLCAYAYPGHESLKTLMPNLIDTLTERHVVRDYSVYDPSGEVYWSVWKSDETSGKLYLLNTDWTTGSNCKEVSVSIGGSRFPFPVFEGAVSEISFSGRSALFMESTASACLTQKSNPSGCTSYSLAGFGGGVLHVLAGEDIVLCIGSEEHRLEKARKPYRFTVDFDDMNRHSIPVSLLRQGAL